MVQRTITPKSILEETFQLHLRVDKLSFEREYKFHPKRRWKFDFADPARMIAIELEGGTWSNGRHTRGQGFQDDCIKYNEAQKLGWQVYRFDAPMVMKGLAIDFIRKLHRTS